MLVPEFRNKFVTVTFQGLLVWPPQQVQEECKLLHDFEVGGDNVQQLCDNLSDQCKLKGLGTSFVTSDVTVLTSFPCVVNLKIYGLYWSDTEFVNEAINAGHPMDPKLAMPNELKEVLNVNLHTADHLLIAQRASFLSHWTNRAKELAKDEMLLKKQMDPEVSKAVSNKRILVFKEMLEATQFPDADVVNELQFGSDLIGEVPATNMLPGKFVPALATPSELHEHSEKVRPNVATEASGSGDAEIDNIVWEKTLAEVSKGWLIGPLNEDQVPAAEPISRRFGLRQKGGKVRLIDDFSASGVNKCVTVIEAPVLHTIDVACAALTMWFGECYKHGLNPKLVVRTFDLTSAYRQVALSACGRRYACIRVFDPKDKRVKFFRCSVLPFGAVRSVHSFLRLARAIWWLGVCGCKLLWTSFYDDYTAYSKPAVSRNTDATIETLFRLLGWVFAEEGDKCMPFGDVCTALGVDLDLTMSSQGLSFVKNTESRVQELCKDLEEVIQAKVLSAKSAQRLRGRMQFAETRIFGRTGKTLYESVELLR